MQSVTLYLNKTDELLLQQSQFRLVYLVKLTCIKAVFEIACSDVFPELVRLEIFGDCQVTFSSARGCCEGDLYVDWPSVEETSNQNLGIVFSSLVFLLGRPVVFPRLHDV